MSPSLLLIFTTRKIVDSNLICNNDYLDKCIKTYNN